MYMITIGLCMTLSIRKSISTECTSSPSVLLISYTKHLFSNLHSLRLAELYVNIYLASESILWLKQLASSTWNSSCKKYPLYIYCFEILFFLFQRTPLHIAAGKGYTDTTESLVAKEADINIKDNDGVSTFHYWECINTLGLSSS